MALLSKDQILSCDDRKTVDVDVPEWGGKVRVATMSAAARDSFDDALIKSQESGEEFRNRRARYVAACLVDDKGEQMFSGEEIEALGKKSSGALDRVFDECLKLNRISAEDVEEEEKN